MKFVTTFLLGFPILFSAAFAKFGISDKDRNKGSSSPEAGDLDLDDPELLAAMEIFAAMSPDEMKETMQELVELLGDDPETRSAIQELLNEIPKMEASDVRSSLKDMVADDEIAVATQDALKILRKSDWDSIWDKRETILEAVIRSGKISVEDAAKLKSDKAAWEAELKFIWNELQKQAAEQEL